MTDMDEREQNLKSYSKSRSYFPLSPRGKQYAHTSQVGIDPKFMLVQIYWCHNKNLYFKEKKHKKQRNTELIS